MSSRVFVALMILGAVVGCGGSPSSPRSSDVFPTAIGSTWSYRWKDLNSGRTDTVVVTLTEEKDLAPWGTGWILVAAHPGWDESAFRVVRGDTISFVPLSPRTLGARFVLPLEAGAAWGSVEDASRVEKVGRVVVPAGTFSDGVLVTWDYPYRFNTMGHASTWVVPGVGIVKETRTEYDLGPTVAYDRELIGFEIPRATN
jgi:hypothetical protein